MPYGDNFRAPKVDIHQFSMIPRSDVPRSTFRIQTQHKTTINASTLYPIFVNEVLPGDTWNGTMAAFCRLSTPIEPIMDNMDIESWFFFTPCRILWQHWINFMGEQPASPSDSISYTIPTVQSPVGGFAAFSIYDYMGLPTVGQVSGGGIVNVNALPLRAYNMIYNQWFRDQNLVTALGYGATFTVYDLGDGPDPYTNYGLLPPCKRHDYFTSALPWTQKNINPVTLPLGTSAPIKTSSTPQVTGTQTAMTVLTSSGGIPTAGAMLGINTAGSNIAQYAVQSGPGSAIYPSNLYADLTNASSATINAIRLAVTTQHLLEKDARGGTRYQELLMSHFGVHPLDARLQRPEYLGGGKSPVNIAPVPQTSGTGASGTTSPLGNLAAVGTAVARGHGFRQSFTEHGYIIGLIAIRADPVYQQGLRRMWTRSTRYDFYWPVFANLGEQAIRNDEIYVTGLAADSSPWGYQERWAEYRQFPSMTSGAFRSTYSAPLDAWHLAEKFTIAPVLNAAFITDKTSTTLVRNLAGGGAVNNEQFLVDLFFDVKIARPMPMYSVPGIGRF